MTAALGRPARSRAAGFLRSAVHPPLRDARFWVVQAMVLLITGFHLSLDLHPSLTGSAFPEGLPVALLLLPVGYAALHYGLSGSAATGLWAGLLWLPDLLLPHDEGHTASDLVNLAIVEGIAFFVGQRIEAERRARAEVERITAETLAIESRYHQLFVQGEEDQRKRIARELHDEPLQLFLHLARSLERLGDDPHLPEPVTAGLGKARLQALDAAGRLRSLTRDLRPPALDQLGFVPALSGLLDDVEDESSTCVDLEVKGAERRLPPEIELGAFRIAEEAVRNAMRHGAAERLCVTVSFDSGALGVRVADDGRGFDPASVAGPESGHLGMLGMRERAKLLGGHLEITSAPGQGTTVVATLPLTAPRLALS